jgi:hypothetical protein
MLFYPGMRREYSNDWLFDIRNIIQFVVYRILDQPKWIRLDGLLDTRLIRLLLEMATLPKKGYRVLSHKVVVQDL